MGTSYSLRQTQPDSQESVAWEPRVGC